MNTMRTTLATCAMAGMLAFLLASCNERGPENGGGKGEKIALDRVPQAVKATIERESKGGSVKATEQVSMGGKTIYAADIIMNGTEQEVRIAEDGTVIERGKKDDDDD